MRRTLKVPHTLISVYCFNRGGEHAIPPKICSSVPAFEDVVGAGTSTKCRMHSSEVTGGFASPGMHYHRRAESAPELDAIDRPTA